MRVHSQVLNASHTMMCGMSHYCPPTLSPYDSGMENAFKVSLKDWIYLEPDQGTSQ
jgi:hypothetical protein